MIITVEGPLLTCFGALGLAQLLLLKAVKLPSPIRSPLNFHANSTCETFTRVDIRLERHGAAMPTAPHNNNVKLEYPPPRLEHVGVKPTYDELPPGPRFFFFLVSEIESS